MDGNGRMKKICLDNNIEQTCAYKTVPASTLHVQTVSILWKANKLSQKFAEKQSPCHVLLLQFRLLFSKSW